MEFEIITDNIYLEKGLLSTLYNKKPIMCGANVIILDITSLKAVSALDTINHPAVCAAIILVESESDSWLFKNIDFLYPVYFLSLRIPLKSLENEVKCIYESLMQRRGCLYSFTKENRSSWVYSYELTALRMFFDNKDIATISKEMKIGQRTALNYINLARRKLNLSVSIKTRILFLIFNKLIAINKMSLPVCRDSECPARLVYMKSIGLNGF